MSDKHAHVRLIDFDEIQGLLPTVTQWDEVIHRPIHIFIATLGFEDRATLIPKTIAAALAGETVDRSAIGLICNYQTNRADNERNRPLLTTALAAFCKQQIDIDAESPQEVESVLGAQITRIAEQQIPVEVVIDISASSAKLILSALHAVLRYKHLVSLRILYAEPARYFPLKEEYEHDPESLVLRSCDVGDPDSPLEYGVDEVEVNELFPGSDAENRPEYVIAVPAIRTNRLVRCLQHLSDQPLSSPDKHVYWIFGEPPASELKWRLAFQKRVVHNTMCSMVGFSPKDTLAPQLNEENSTTCSTRDYRDILRTVLEVADQRVGHNISIVHMGSKLQAVGIAFALSVRSEITVCSASPVQFNSSRYTEGFGPMWQIDMPSLSSVSNLLGKVGELTFTPRIETQRSGRPEL